MENGRKIVLGSGKLYCVEYSGSLPESETIEDAENQLGLIQGGASIEYKPSYYEAKDDLGQAVKTVLTAEEATFKSGIMTWNGKTLAKLTNTARVEEDTAQGRRTVKIGGLNNYDGKRYLFRFVNDDKTDGKTRVTVVGNNQAGFTMAFAVDKETVIDAEIKAMPCDGQGTLVIYEEEIPKIVSPSAQ